MKVLVAAIFLSLTTGVCAIYHKLDSVSSCSSSPSNDQVYDWEKARVKLGRDHSLSISSLSRCEIQLYADVDFTDETRRLKIDVVEATFDNNLIKVEIHDGSTSASPILVTLHQGNAYGTYNSTQPYVYIVVDKSSCSSQSCREGLDVDLRISNHAGVLRTYYELSTAAIVGIAIGGCVGLMLLVGVPICVCFCCFAAASRRQQRTNTPMVTTTTASNVNPALAYPQQQYIVQGAIVTPYQPQPDYNLQVYQAGAPPSYPVASQYHQQQANEYPQMELQQQPQ